MGDMGMEEEDVSNAYSAGLEERRRSKSVRKKLPAVKCSSKRVSANNWTAEPSVGRVANGIPSRVDRIKSLGNAVVPQIVEIIGRAIMEI